ncbi:hypothetical protein [Candidatus Vidania fulgoroideorum]
MIESFKKKIKNAEIDFRKKNDLLRKNFINDNFWFLVFKNQKPVRVKNDDKIVTLYFESKEKLNTFRKFFTNKYKLDFLIDLKKKLLFFKKPIFDNDNIKLVKIIEIFFIDFKISIKLIFEKLKRSISNIKEKKRIIKDILNYYRNIVFLNQKYKEKKISNILN